MNSQVVYRFAKKMKRIHKAKRMSQGDIFVRLELIERTLVMLRVGTKPYS